MSLNINPSFIPIRTRKLIVNDFKEGVHPDTIAKNYKIKSNKTILKYIDRVEDTGDVLSEYELLKKYGKETKIKIFDDDNKSMFVENECIEHPITTLNQYVDDIFGNFGLYISRETVRRHFASKVWTYKRISRIAFECDIEEEYLFWQFMGDIITDPDQLMFLDESNRNDCTSNKRRGRGPGYVTCFSYINVRFIIFQIFALHATGEFMYQFTLFVVHIGLVYY